VQPEALWLGYHPPTYSSHCTRCRDVMVTSASHSVARIGISCVDNDVEILYVVCFFT